MPTSDQILSGLGDIANHRRGLAVAWHVYFGLLALVLAVGPRPSRRLIVVLLALPLISVSVLAWFAGNPFNGAIFAIIAIAAMVVAISLPDRGIQIAFGWPVAAGAVLLGFGGMYPHFLETKSVWSYLYAAPLGLIPCPS